MKAGFLNDVNNDNSNNNNDKDNLGPLEDKRSNTKTSRVKFHWSDSAPSNQKSIRNSWVKTTTTTTRTAKKVVMEEDIIEEFKTEAEELVTKQYYEVPSIKSGLRVQIQKDEEERKRREREKLWNQANSLGGEEGGMVVDNIPEDHVATAMALSALANSSPASPQQVPPPPQVPQFLLGSQPPKTLLPQPPQQLQTQLQPQQIQPPQTQQLLPQQLPPQPKILLPQPPEPNYPTKKQKVPTEEVEEGELIPPPPHPTLENPYSNIPTLPHKTSGAPKNALQAFVMQKFQIQLTNENFKCRNNGGPPHDVRWTCTFTTPQTNEVFECGKYGNSAFYVEVDGVVWYKKRKLAEHACAARALDCLMYREFQKDSSTWRICEELPYGEKRDNDELYGTKRGFEMQMEDDTRFRNDYQNLRKTPAPPLDNMEEDDDKAFRERYNALKFGDNYG